MKANDVLEPGAVDDFADSAGDRAKSYVDAGVDALHNVSGKARQMGQQADGYVRDNPWVALGVAAGAGLLIGWLVRGRR